MLKDMDPQMVQFQRLVREYYRLHGRHDLPWRLPEPDGHLDAYKILVSEVMLQQTQVGRVTPKYEAFLRQFPSFADLSRVPLAEVLQAWSGLGYNRRAKFLWQAAQAVVTQHSGHLPYTAVELTALPGVGPNTAGAVLAYAYNRPVVFIETNIRTIFIHHFFADRQDIPDREILDLVARSLPDDARNWYWALMDYGAHLKQTVGNLNVRSRQYTRQSTFAGSRRQLRGQVLRLLGQTPHTTTMLHTAVNDERLEAVLVDLQHEGLIGHTAAVYHLPGSVV